MRYCVFILSKGRVKRLPFFWALALGREGRREALVTSTLVEILTIVLGTPRKIAHGQPFCDKSLEVKKTEVSKEDRRILNLKAIRVFSGKSVGNFSKVVGFFLFSFRGPLPESTLLCDSRKWKMSRITFLFLQGLQICILKRSSPVYIYLWRISICRTIFYRLTFTANVWHGYRCHL